MCVFKKIMAYAVICVLMCCLSANAANLDKITQDAKIQSALIILEQNGSQHLVNNLAKNRINVKFYDLSMISYEYARHYAMRADTQNGKQYILINSKFKSAPTEAIACLVAHEAVHNLPNATFAEEIMATSVEAKTWIQIRDNIDYQNSTNPLVKRLNRNANRYLSSATGISTAIAQNSTYRKQFGL